MVLKSFRDASHSFAIKILFTAIILSFCLWGVGDIIRNYTSSRAIITVNKKRVTVEQFLNEYSHEKQRIQNMNKNPLTNEELTKLGIKDAVIEHLLDETVLECVYEQLGILVPKQTLVELIHSLPQFQSNGGFDSRIYTMALRSSGMSESGFLNDVRNNMLKTQLFHSLMAGYKIPKVAKKMIVDDFTARYKVLYKKINLDKLAKRTRFTNDELRQYYENNKEKYSIPETRDISVLVIDYSKVTGSLTVNEDDVERVYQETKDLYVKEETRTFERLMFEDKRAAEKAWSLLSTGKSINEVTKKLLPTLHEIKGARRKDFSKDIGDMLFKLHKGKVSDVYKIGEKFYIYLVKDIQSHKQMTKGEIKSEIREDMKNEMQNSPGFYAKVKEIKNQIDDAIGAGKSINEIAKETGMRVEHIYKINKNRDQQQLKDLISDPETYNAVRDAIFETEEGQVTQTIETQKDDTKSYVAYIERKNPKSVPEYEKVSEKVKRDYTRDAAEKSVKEELTEIQSLGSNGTKQIRNQYSPDEYSFSKTDAYDEHPSNAVSKIRETIPNKNTLVAIFSGLRDGEVTYEKIDENTYVIIGIEKEKGSTERYSEKEENDVLKQIDTISRNDMIKLVKAAYKARQKVKVRDNLANQVVTERTDAE